MLILAIPIIDGYNFNIEIGFNWSLLLVGFYTYKWYKIKGYTPKYINGVQYDIILAFAILFHNDMWFQRGEDRNGNRIYL